MAHGRQPGIIALEWTVLHSGSGFKERIFANPRAGEIINLSIFPIQTHQEGIARRVLFVVKLR